MASSDQFEDAKIFWTQALAPANEMEKRLVTSIARQDFMMFAAMKRAVAANQGPALSRYLRMQRDLACTLDSLIHALSTLQRQRLALEPPPPVTAAKVIPFPNRSSAGSPGRPAKIELEPDSISALEPFNSNYRIKKARVGRPSLDLRLVA